MNNNLKNSPIYNLSMCSFENFHTNFLCWFLNLNIKEHIKIFDKKSDITNNSYIAKTQEKYKNLKFDIIIKQKNNTDYKYIIENKIKSYPNETQLKTYSKYMNKSKFILLTFAPYKTDLKEWKILNYSDIKNSIKEIQKNTKFDIYTDSLIKDYINVLENLITNFNAQKENYKYNFYKNIKINKDLQIIYIKYRTSSFANYIKCKINDNNLNVETDFSHEQGIINISKIYKIYNINFKILVQIQGKQYRYAMICGNDNKKDERLKLAEELMNKNLWFNKTQTIEYYPRATYYYNKKTKPSNKNFCGYKNDFIYRYENLDNNTSYIDIVKKINDDFSQLKNNENNIIKIFKKYKNNII